VINNGIQTFYGPNGTTTGGTFTFHGTVTTKGLTVNGVINAGSFGNGSNFYYGTNTTLSLQSDGNFVIYTGGNAVMNCTSSGIMATVSMTTSLNAIIGNIIYTNDIRPKTGGAIYFGPNGYLYDDGNIAIRAIGSTTSLYLQTLGGGKSAELDNVGNFKLLDGNFFINQNNRLYLSGTDTTHYIYSSGNGGNNMFFCEYSQWNFFSTQSNTTVASINSSGTVTASGFNATSDYRIKTDITPITNLTIDHLQPCSYTNTRLNSFDVGFIAHEVQQYYPFMVMGEKDATNENGEPIYQSINYQAIIPILVAEVKELKQQLKQQRRYAILIICLFSIVYIHRSIYNVVG
jgi:hypothetical protein